MQLRKLLHIPPTRYTTRQTAVWLWRAWRGNRTQATLNATIGLAQVVVTLAQVWAVKRAIDIAAGTLPGNIYWAVSVMALLILTDFAFNIAAIWVRNILGIKAQNRMQQRMLDRILRSEWGGQERLHSGDVLNRLEFDVNTVVNFLTETLPSTLSVLALFFGAFFYLFSMDHTLAFIIVGIIPVFVAFSKIYVGQMRHLTRSVREADSKVQSVLQETIQHRMLIKTLESDDEMYAALDKSCAQFVRELPQGLDTLCSEQGGGLSEGQAQRIAIARALLRDRQVMLFDEATSALDPETERQLLQNILSSHEKTVIFITHRPAVVDYCDQTLTLCRQ